MAKKGLLKARFFVDGVEVEKLTEEQSERAAQNVAKALSEYYSKPEHYEEWKQLPPVI